VRVVTSLTVLVASLTPRRLAFNDRQPHEGFAAEKVAREQLFLQVLRFPSVSIIPPIAHADSCTLAVDSNVK